jgi:hypothetical protein
MQDLVFISLRRRRMRGCLYVVDIALGTYRPHGPHIDLSLGISVEFQSYIFSGIYFYFEAYLIYHSSISWVNVGHVCPSMWSLYFIVCLNSCVTMRSAFQRFSSICYTMVYPKVSGLASWSENWKWYNSVPLDAVVSLFCESV